MFPIDTGSKICACKTLHLCHQKKELEGASKQFYDFSTSQKSLPYIEHGSLVVYENHYKNKTIEQIASWMFFAIGMIHDPLRTCDHTLLIILAFGDPKDRTQRFFFSSTWNFLREAIQNLDPAFHLTSFIWNAWRFVACGSCWHCCALYLSKFAPSCF